MHTVSRGKEENLKSLQRHDTILLGKLPVMDRTGGPPPNAVFLQHADKPVTPAAFMTSRLISLLKGPGGVIAQPKMHTFQCYYPTKGGSCFRVPSKPYTHTAHSDPASLGIHDAGQRPRHPRHQGRIQASASAQSSVNRGSCKRLALSVFWWCWQSGMP